MTLRCCYSEAVYVSEVSAVAGSTDSLFYLEVFLEPLPKLFDRALFEIFTVSLDFNMVYQLCLHHFSTAGLTDSDSNHIEVSPDFSTG